MIDLDTKRMVAFIMWYLGPVVFEVSFTPIIRTTDMNPPVKIMN